MDSTVCSLATKSAPSCHPVTVLSIVLHWTQNMSYMLEEIRRETVIDSSACLQCMYNEKLTSAYWVRTKNSRKTNEWQKDRKYDVDTRRGRERESEPRVSEKRRVVEHLHGHPTALTYRGTGVVHKTSRQERDIVDSKSNTASILQTSNIHLHYLQHIFSCNALKIQIFCKLKKVIKQRYDQDILVNVSTLTPRQPRSVL